MMWSRCLLRGSAVAADATGILACSSHFLGSCSFRSVSLREGLSRELGVGVGGRSESSGAVLEMMQQALDRVSSSDAAAQESRIACRAAYRLAHFADSMYRSVQEQRRSPEFAAAQAVIRSKRSQVPQHLCQLSMTTAGLCHKMRLTPRWEQCCIGSACCDGGGGRYKAAEPGQAWNFA